MSTKSRKKPTTSIDRLNHLLNGTGIYGGANETSPKPRKRGGNASNKKLKSSLRPTAPSRQPEDFIPGEVDANGIIRMPREVEQMARLALATALYAGLLTRKPDCEKCGKTRSTSGHHTDYSKPLEVIWLCRWCHHEAHRKPARCESM